ncbi:MAG: helix-turn-helix domain-containing protein [Desulfobacterales bacterium]|nr:helix-turn-helix domain-containing protein [Desulfobacterales bacterium]
MSYSHLSSEERYVITYLVLYDLSSREIARRLNRHHTTISREIKRNRVMGDVVSYFHICYLYSNILLIVIPVKQVIEPGMDRDGRRWQLCKLIFYQTGLT